MRALALCVCLLCATEAAAESKRSRVAIGIAALAAAAAADAITTSQCLHARPCQEDNHLAKVVVLKPSKIAAFKVSINAVVLADALWLRKARPSPGELAGAWLGDGSARRLCGWQRAFVMEMVGRMNPASGLKAMFH